MIVQNFAHFPIRARLYLEARGFGEDKLIMGEGGRESLNGPLLFWLPEGGRYFSPEGIIRVTEVHENPETGILCIPSNKSRFVSWRDEDGKVVGIQVCHFKLDMPNI